MSNEPKETTLERIRREEKERFVTRLVDKMDDDLHAYLPKEREYDNDDRKFAATMLKLQLLREIRDALRALRPPRLAKEGELPPSTTQSSATVAFDVLKASN